MFHQVSDDGIIHISITADRAKYRNRLPPPMAGMAATQERPPRTHPEGVPEVIAACVCVGLPR